MYKPLTNRQIVNRWVGLLINKQPDVSLQEIIKDELRTLTNTRPAMSSKDRHSIIINTITRYVRYLLEQEDTTNGD